MLTEKDYCDYDTCVALKEMGYKGTSRFFYATKESPLRRYSYDQILTIRIANAVGHTLAISLYVAQKWLREEKRIGVFVSGFKNGYTFWVNNLLSGDTLYQGFFDNQTGEKYKSYEEALSEGIKAAVKILKEK
jgi:hypothetical protein